MRNTKFQKSNSKPPVYKIRLKKGDNVVVLAGKEKGKTGKVIQTHAHENKVTVENINVVKKAVKPNKQYPQGAIIDLTKPIWTSKVAAIDPTSKKPSKIGYKTVGGKKVRVYKRSGKEIKS
jgi:large subunit ribosomal protein L24